MAFEKVIKLLRDLDGLASRRNLDADSSERKKAYELARGLFMELETAASFLDNIMLQPQQNAAIRRLRLEAQHRAALTLIVAL